MRSLRRERMAELRSPPEKGIVFIAPRGGVIGDLLRELRELELSRRRIGFDAKEEEIACWGETVALSVALDCLLVFLPFPVSDSSSCLILGSDPCAMLSSC